MKITRLGWAGLELEAAGRLAVIDLLQDATPMEGFMGRPHTPLPAPSRAGAADLALVTHLHQDHADPPAIAAALAPGGVLLRPAPDEGAFLEVAATKVAEEGLAEHGVAQRVLAPWETVEAGPFRVTAIPAADGFGDPQVSWVVEAEGTRMTRSSTAGGGGRGCASAISTSPSCRSTARSSTCPTASPGRRAARS